MKPKRLFAVCFSQPETIEKKLIFRALVKDSKKDTKKAAKNGLRDDRNVMSS